MAEKTPTPPADPSTPRPDDLVTVKEAAALVDRSVSSVRAWLRAGKLEKHREEPGNESSRALLSRSALLAFARSALDIDPGRPSPGPRAEPPAAAAPMPEGDATLRAELARLRVELDGTRAVLEATRAHVATLEGNAATVGALVTAAQEEGQKRAHLAEEHARGLRADLERMRDERDAARAEADALKSYVGLPWWRRLVTGPTASIEG